MIESSEELDTERRQLVMELERVAADLGEIDRRLRATGAYHTAESVGRATIGVMLAARMLHDVLRSRPGRD